MLKGVIEVTPGYAGGSPDSATYERVSTGTTGHAEVIRITYDPAMISYIELLKIFFAAHDPTTRNRQGNDVGTQYRSVIFVLTPEQEATARAAVREVQASFPNASIVTEVVPLDIFWPAEEYHHAYYQNNSDVPYCQAVIEPKCKKIEETFPFLVKDNASGG